MDHKNSILVKIDREDHVNDNSEYCVLSEMIQRKNEKQTISNKEPSRHCKQGENVKLFECNRCNKRCLSKRDMIHHWKIHDMEIYKCTKCDRAFASKNSLSYHTKSHSGIKYKCDICQRQFNDKSNMKKHRNIHLNINNYKCAKCSKAFSDPSAFKQHMDKHAGIRYKCTFCEKIFTSKQYLKRHLNCHLNLKGARKPYPCDKCKDTGFDHKNQLETHQNKQHLDIEYKCHHCQNVFYSKLAMNRHLKIHSPQFNCTHKGCIKRFADFTRLKTHIEVWHENKLLACVDCGKMFRGKNKLREHRDRVHLTVRPHVCSICGASFSRNYLLLAHDRSVHSFILYKCLQCSFQCKSKRQFTYHMRQGVHSKLEPQFECAMCMMKYHHKFSLQDHIMAKHMKTKLLHCDVCDHSTYRIKDIRKHKKNHVAMEYHCKHCSKKFSDVEQFRSHLSEHLVKPLQCIDDKWKEHVAQFKQLCNFNCNSCNKRFLTLRNLKLHIRRMHCEGTLKCEYCGTLMCTGHELKCHIEKDHLSITYECSQCNCTYHDKSSLRSHMRKGKCYKNRCSTNETSLLTLGKSAIPSES